MIGLLFQPREYQPQHHIHQLHHPRLSDETRNDRFAGLSGCSPYPQVLLLLNARCPQWYRHIARAASPLDLSMPIWLQAITLVEQPCRSAARSYEWKPFYCSLLSAIGHLTTRGPDELWFTEMESRLLVNTAGCKQDRSVNTSSNNPFLFYLLTLPYFALHLIFQSPRPSFTSVSSSPSPIKILKGHSK